MRAVSPYIHESLCELASKDAAAAARATTSTVTAGGLPS